MYFELDRALLHIDFDIDLHLEEFLRNILRHHIDGKGLFSFQAAASLKRRHNTMLLPREDKFKTIRFLT